MADFLTSLRFDGLTKGLGPEGGVPVGVGLRSPAGVMVSEACKKGVPWTWLVGEAEAPGALVEAGVWAGVMAAVPETEAMVIDPVMVAVTVTEPDEVKVAGAVAEPVTDPETVGVSVTGALSVVEAVGVAVKVVEAVAELVREIVTEFVKEVEMEMETVMLNEPETVDEIEFEKETPEDKGTGKEFD